MTNPIHLPSKQMIGAEAVIRTLLAGGVDTCFTNPGASEIHLVAELDRTPDVRCVLGLFEGVVTGAADGYARMAEKPALTMLHLGPGLANGLANLHNAHRAQVPMINIVGDHATHHLRHDTPLTSDIEAIARPYSRWLRSSSSASEVGYDVAEAITASRTSPGGVATLIIPADVSWAKGGVVPRIPMAPRAPVPAIETVEHAATMLRSGLRTAIVLTGNALYGKGLIEAGRIARATGAKLFSPYPFTRLERGAGIPVVERIFYVLEQAKQQLEEFRQFILVGAPAPMAYFAYEGQNSTLTSPECELYTLARNGEDCIGALKALAAALSLGQQVSSAEKNERSVLCTGELTLSGIAAVIGALLPENAIVVDESMTSGRDIMPATKTAPRHEWLGNTGGAIGIAMPLALGAAVACPDCKVLCLTADGSGMYTIQALWSMAREGVNVTIVVFNNRKYAVLKREFMNLGLGNPGQRALDMFELNRPELDWLHLAKGMGVPATRVTSIDVFAKALRRGFESDGPSLIEVPL
ncbi:MAG: acetolactate synthase large subunit [Acidobacteriaceae bacterium]|nr:acetolactate synthase large subunit [Acidobacteriaceae bacterium]